MVYSGQGRDARLEGQRVAPLGEAQNPLQPTRYIQLADPVYQVHPPRPSWPAAVYTSAATTYGSTFRSPPRPACGCG